MSDGHFEMSDNGLDDVRAVGIKNDFFIVASDFEKIEEAVKNCEDDQLLDCEWYRFELARETKMMVGERCD